MIYKREHILLITQILLAIMLVLHLPLRVNRTSVILFWPFFWLIIAISFIIVSVCPRRYKIASLIVLEIFLSLIFLVSAPNIFQMERDVYFESQYASTLIGEGRWDPTLGAGFAQDYYGYNPALHFMLALSSLTTGVITYALSKYFYFTFLRVMLVLLIFLLISMFFKKDKQGTAYLATFIFIASSGMAFIEISRRLIADIFMILALYAILKYRAEPDNKMWDALFYVFSALVVIGNHSIAYLLLLLLAGMWLFGIIAKTRLFGRFFTDGKYIENYPRVLFKLVYFLIIFFLWEALVSPYLLMTDFSYISSITRIISSGYGVKLIFNLEGAQPSTFIYHSYEIITIYIYHAAFMLLSIAGLVLFVIRLKSRSRPEYLIENKIMLLYIGFFSLIMYALSFALMKTELDPAAYTFLWFFCIPLSIFIAYLLDEGCPKVMPKSALSILSVLILVLFYTGHLFIGMYTPRITNRALDEDIVLGMDIRSQSPELYYSASWLNKNADKNSKVMGDINVFEVYAGLFNFDVSTDEYRQKQLYNGTITQLTELLSDKEVYFGSYKHTVHYDSLDYLIINSRFFNYLNYLFGKPVEAEKAEKFDKTEFMDKVYDNRKIAIYHNTHQEN